MPSAAPAPASSIEVPVAGQAVPFLIGLGLIAVLLAAVAGPWGAAVPVLLALFVLFFFRDPERRAPEGEGLVLAPADGRVTAVDLAPTGARISIFLSAFDCHINRSPVAGRVVQARYTPGRFLPAWQGRASHDNERNDLTIRAAHGEYGVTQIAGIMARRIVCTKAPGDDVTRGERIGLIRFGSRTDLRLPPGVTPLVSIGSRVRGGVTIVAREAAAVGRSGASAAVAGARS